MKKIKELIKKILTKEVILYTIFGLLTTAVNLVSFWIMNSLLHWDENVANAIAIVVAVIFAYFVNKDFVFHSDAYGFKERIVQFFRFILGRTFTMLLEFGGGFLLFMTPIPPLIVKIILTVIVIILNYFISKFFAFKKKTDKETK